jgi:hypothetical protein
MSGEWFPMGSDRGVVGTTAGTTQAAGFVWFPVVPASGSRLVPMRRNHPEPPTDFASTYAGGSHSSRAYRRGTGTTCVGRSKELPRQPMKGGR